MKKSQTLEIRISEIRQSIVDQPATATETEVAELRAQLSAATAEHRAALQSEFEAMDDAGTADSPENRELARLRQRADVGVMLGAALVGGQLPIGSAEAEARAGMLSEHSGANSIPMQMLFGAVAEERAELLIPQRIQVSTKISVEDRARYPNFGAAVDAAMSGDWHRFGC